MWKRCADHDFSGFATITGKFGRAARFTACWASRIVACTYNDASLFTSTGLTTFLRMRGTAEPITPHCTTKHLATWIGPKHWQNNQCDACLHQILQMWLLLAYYAFAQVKAQDFTCKTSVLYGLQCRLYTSLLYVDSMHIQLGTGLHACACSWRILANNWMVYSTGLVLAELHDIVQLCYPRNAVNTIYIYIYARPAVELAATT